MKKAIIYIHGKGGSIKEADRFRSLFPEHTVVGFDYVSDTPWEAKREFSDFFSALKKDYGDITVVANSIGAFFSIVAGIDGYINRAYFISPVVDMEELIKNMMACENITEDELRTKWTVQTSFGERLSWDYLSYVRENQIKWNCPTEILYGENDSLVPYETITEFSEKNKANVTVMENGEHWFHTREQMAFLDRWVTRSEIIKETV